MKAKLIAIALTLSVFSCEASNKEWPFDQPKNTAVFTFKQIVSRQVPILWVSHDAEDHGWQFLNPSIETIEANASLVGLGEIVKLDPTVLEIADLPPGWRAFRKAVGGKWIREKKPVSEKK